MAAHLGEVAGLISLVQLRTGLGVEGLGRARQRAAGGGRRDLRAVLQLILDGIGQQLFRIPLGIQIQITFDRHFKVERLFFAGFSHIEPADKRVFAVLRIRRRTYCCAVRNIIDRSQRRFIAFHCFLGQVSLNCVGLRNPTRIKRRRMSGHFRRIKVQVCTVRKAFGCIPAAERICTGFHIGRVVRLVVLALQRFLIIQLFCCFVFTEEIQFILVSGIVEVYNICFTILSGIRVNHLFSDTIPRGKSNKGRLCLGINLRVIDRIIHIAQIVIYAIIFRCFFAIGCIIQNRNPNFISEQFRNVPINRRTIFPETQESNRIIRGLTEAIFPKKLIIQLRILALYRLVFIMLGIIDVMLAVPSGHGRYFVWPVAVSAQMIHIVYYINRPQIRQVSTVFRGEGKIIIGILGAANRGFIRSENIPPTLVGFQLRKRIYGASLGRTGRFHKIIQQLYFIACISRC